MEAPKLEFPRYRKTIKQGDELVSIVSLLFAASNSQVFMRSDSSALQAGSRSMQQDELHLLVKFAEQGNLNGLRAMHLVRIALAFLPAACCSLILSIFIPGAPPPHLTPYLPF